MPPDPLPDLGPAAAIVVDYPLAGWAFSAATFTATGQPHARSQTVALAVGADGSHLLKPVGRAGTYDVFLNGSGGGQVSGVFRWPTPVDGPSPEPEALLASSDPSSWCAAQSSVSRASTSGRSSSSLMFRCLDG